MSQVDLATFPVIVFWTFVIFGSSFLLFSVYFLPLFISKVKLFVKLSNFVYSSGILILYRIKALEETLPSVSLLVLFKAID